MTNLKTFKQKANFVLEKAIAIYAEMRKNGTYGRSAWLEALRQGWKLVKAIVRGEVSFWKLKTGEQTVRKIELLGERFPDYQLFSNGLVRVWDCVQKKLISFHPYQII